MRGESSWIHRRVEFNADGYNSALRSAASTPPSKQPSLRQKQLHPLFFTVSMVTGPKKETHTHSTDSSSRAPLISISNGNRGWVRTGGREGGGKMFICDVKKKTKAGFVMVRGVPGCPDNCWQALEAVPDILRPLREAQSLVLEMATTLKNPKTGHLPKGPHSSLFHWFRLTFVDGWRLCRRSLSWLWSSHRKLD